VNKHITAILAYTPTFSEYRVALATVDKCRTLALAGGRPDNRAWRLAQDVVEAANWVRQYPCQGYEYRGMRKVSAIVEKMGWKQLGNDRNARGAYPLAGPVGKLP